MTIQNSGVTSITTQNTVQNTVNVTGGAVANNMRDNCATKVSAYAPKNVILLVGLNDLRLNDAAFTVQNFQNDLGEMVDGIVAGGVSESNIVIGSPPYNTEASYAAASPWDGGSRSKHAAYTAACAAVASEKGTKYADVYQYMTDNGGDSLVGVDGIHPNDAGHVAIAAAFLAVL